MFQKFNGVTIEHISSCVPSRRIRNSSFSNLLNDKELKMFEKTVGILERRWVENKVTASDLGYNAALEILNKKNTDINSIKSLIFLSQTSDFKIPFTSNILQHKLGLKKDILCLDINAGCAGFIQGLSTAFSIATTLQKGQKVLLVIAETLSKILSSSDRSTTMLFGDGASAILINKTDEISDQSFFNFFSDGENYKAIIIPDGGYRNVITEKSFKLISDDKNETKNSLQLSMDGPSVFDFTLREIYPSIVELFKYYEKDLDKVDKFLFHQSNKFIIKQLASKLGIEDDKVPVNIQEYGNTSGVSIPLLISSFYKSFSITNKVVCSGYGSGLNWGNCIIDISKTIIDPIKEI
jgi:3-oxoacyl-[acyl-carrier-protein] synthase-3